MTFLLIISFFFFFFFFYFYFLAWRKSQYNLTARDFAAFSSPN